VFSSDVHDEGSVIRERSRPKFVVPAKACRPDFLISYQHT